MNSLIKQHFATLHSKDATLRYAAFLQIIKTTEQPVDWVYAVWDELLLLIKTGDNHQRTIAVQVLSNLAKSDTEQRLVKDLAAIMLVTKDEKFVTARHSLQCLWKVGIVDNTFRDKLNTALSKRFKECIAEKNCTLIRYDIIGVFRKMFDITNDTCFKDIPLSLIQTEEDEKYRKKYLGVWKDVLKAK